MRRRALLVAAVLGGCARPYLERRDWPLQARRGAVVGPPVRAPVLLVRSLRAAPGLEARGLRTLAADGSVHIDAYEQWSVPPADAVEDQLRRWLAECGLFAAVLPPGSRAPADLALEGELLALIAEPAHGLSRVALGVVLIDLHPASARVRLQDEISGVAPLSRLTGPDVAQSGCAALRDVLVHIEDRLRSAL